MRLLFYILALLFVVKGIEPPTPSKELENTKE